MFLAPSPMLGMSKIDFSKNTFKDKTCIFLTRRVTRMDWAKNEKKGKEKYKNKAENKNAIESRKREKEKVVTFV